MFCQFRTRFGRREPGRTEKEGGGIPPAALLARRYQNTGTEPSSV